VTRDRITRLCLGLLTLVGSVGIGLVSSTGSPPAAAATPAAATCLFEGAGFPIVFGATPGTKVAINCTGLTPLHPYLVFETSLLLAIDPKAAPLLQGNVTSVPGLLSLISSLPEINALALTFVHSDAKGNLNDNYTLPRTHALDPNATCPPSGTQFRTGLIGCGLTMIDLTTFKPVAAGSALVQYVNEPFTPVAPPTLSLSTTSAAPGATVDVSDAAGAKTWWWLSTLTSLLGLLGGGSAPTTLHVRVSNGTKSALAANTITVSPAVYNAPTLTPPKLSGSFTVPPGITGSVKVTVSYSASLEGFPLVNSASAPLNVS